MVPLGGHRIGLRWSKQQGSFGRQNRVGASFLPLSYATLNVDIEDRSLVLRVLIIKQMYVCDFVSV